MNSLFEKMNINFPKWVDGLTDSHWLKEELYSEIKDAFSNVSVLKTSRWRNSKTTKPLK